MQSIVDALHISHIEIRDENSLDLKPYIFKKVCTVAPKIYCSLISLSQTIKQHIIEMDENINRIRAPLTKLLEVRRIPFSYWCRL